MKRFNFEEIASLVESGENHSFENWKEFTGCKKEDFIAGVKWIAEDPHDDKDRVTRAIGCRESGEIVKLVYSHGSNASPTAIYELESGAFWYSGKPMISSCDGKELHKALKHGW